MRLRNVAGKYVTLSFLKLNKLEERKNLRKKKKKKTEKRRGKHYRLERPKAQARGDRWFSANIVFSPSSFS